MGVSGDAYYNAPAHRLFPARPEESARATSGARPAWGLARCPTRRTGTVKLGDCLCAGRVTVAVLRCRTRCLVGHRETNHQSPGGVAFHRELAWHRSRRSVTPNPEMIADRSERFEKALRLLRRLEPTHHPLTLPCGLV